MSPREDNQIDSEFKNKAQFVNDYYYEDKKETVQEVYERRDSFENNNDIIEE